MAAVATPKPPADGVRGSQPEFFDAILVVAFGGPEGMDDVMPFLENVTRGRNIPRERLEEVAHHYARFGGVSPINAQNRALIAALRPELDAARDRPADLLRQPQLASVPGRHAARDARRRDPAGARLLHQRLQLLLELPAVPREHRRAQAAVGPDAPEVARTRMFYNHPGFVEANAEHVAAALAIVAEERRAGAHLAFTAHSIPPAMARQSRYESQLGEAARLVAERGRRR